LWIYTATASYVETMLMPEMINLENQSQKVGVKRMKRHSLRIDMTPMVDLGFLLISFFVMTVQMSKPYETKFNMPKDGTDSKLQNSAALNVILGDNREVWYYHGDWKEAKQKKQIFKTSFSYKHGLGDIIREKQIQLDHNPLIREGRKDLTILIKPSGNSNYTGIVDVLDEITINDVKCYALVKITEEEKTFLKEHQY
jgi:biopolymer transport protein ExbD